MIKLYLLGLLLISLKLNSQEKPDRYYINYNETNNSINFNPYLNSSDCLQSYFSVSVQEIGIPDEKKFLRDFHPVALVELNAGDKKIINVFGENKIGDNKEYFHFNNEIITDFTPYKGENLTVRIKLLSVKKNDKILNSINYISSIVEYLPQNISLITEEAKKIYEKTDEFLKSNDHAFHYKFTLDDPNLESVTVDPMKQGYYFICKSPIIFDPNKFSFENSNLTYDGKSVKDLKLNYVLIRIDKKTFLNKNFNFFDKITNLRLTRDLDDETIQREYDRISSEVFSTIDNTNELSNYEKMTHKNKFNKLFLDRLVQSYPNREIDIHIDNRNYCNNITKEVKGYYKLKAYSGDNVSYLIKDNKYENDYKNDHINDLIKILIEDFGYNEMQLKELDSREIEMLYNKRRL